MFDNVIDEDALRDKVLRPSLEILRQNVEDHILRIKEQFKEAEIIIGPFQIPEIKIKIKING